MDCRPSCTVLQSRASQDNRRRTISLRKAPRDTAGERLRYDGQLGDWARAVYSYEPHAGQSPWPGTHRHGRRVH